MHTITSNNKTHLENNGTQRHLYPGEFQFKQVGEFLFLTLDLFLRRTTSQRLKRELMTCGTTTVMTVGVKQPVCCLFDHTFGEKT